MIKEWYIWSLFKKLFFFFLKPLTDVRYTFYMKSFRKEINNKTALLCIIDSFLLKEFVEKIWDSKT